MVSFTCRRSSSAACHWATLRKGFDIRGVFWPPSVRKLATPSKRNPSLQGGSIIFPKVAKRPPCLIQARLFHLRPVSVSKLFTLSLVSCCLAQGRTAEALGNLAGSHLRSELGPLSWHFAQDKAGIKAQYARRPLLFQVLLQLCGLARCLLQLLCQRYLAPWLHLMHVAPRWCQRLKILAQKSQDMPGKRFAPSAVFFKRLCSALRAVSSCCVEWSRSLTYQELTHTHTQSASLCSA